MIAALEMLFGTPGTWVTFFISFIVILMKRPLPSRETLALMVLLNLPAVFLLLAAIADKPVDTGLIYLTVLFVLGLAGPGFALLAWMSGVLLVRFVDSTERAKLIAEQRAHARADGSVAENATADQGD